MATLIKRGDIYLIRRGFWPFWLYLDDTFSMWWWGRSDSSLRRDAAFPTEDAAMDRWRAYKTTRAKSFVPPDIKVRPLR